MGGVEMQMKGPSYVEEQLNLLLPKNIWLVPTFLAWTNTMFIFLRTLSGIQILESINALEFQINVVIGQSRGTSLNLSTILPDKCDYVPYILIYIGTRPNAGSFFLPH